VTIDRVQPEGLHATPGYAHVTTVFGHATVLLSGQCPLGPDGDVVGGDSYEAQADQIVLNVRAALAAVGAQPADVVQTRVYVVSDDGDVLGRVWRRFAASALAEAFTSASTIVGVNVLAYPGQLVELDVTAALPQPAH
jgi:enamine deaminase RidA (YjgF/YER057c/UK114 family)